MDPGLDAWLARARDTLTNPAILHAAMAQTMLDGGKLGGRAIPGVARHIKDNAPRFHKTATALKANFTNFYEAAAGGIQIIASEQAAGLLFVNGAPFIARAYEASVIRPGDGKQWIAIPAIAEAYGMRAREFGDRLEFQPRGPNLGILTWRTHPVRKRDPDAPAKAATALKAARASSSRKPSTAEKCVVVYWCVREVNQKRDPSIMPPDQDLLDLAKVGVARAMMTPAGLVPLA